MTRFIPQKIAGHDEYSLFDKETGTYSLIQQGFGVCDRVADALNFGTGPAVGEIADLADSIQKRVETKKESPA